MLRGGCCSMQIMLLPVSPIKVLIPALVASLLIQLPAHAPLMQQPLPSTKESWVGLRAPGFIHKGELGGAQGSWFHSGPALSAVVI